MTSKQTTRRRVRRLDEERSVFNSYRAKLHRFQKTVSRHRADKRCQFIDALMQTGAYDVFLTLALDVDDIWRGGVWVR